MTKEKSLMKDFHTLMKNIKSFSDGQATVTKWDDADLQTFEVTIAPNGGLYKDGEFVFEIQTDENFPEVPPRIYAKTAIYHPNIDTMDDPDGEICLNLFDADIWSSQCGLEDVIQGLLFLLHNPNLDDPLCSQFSSGMSDDEFERNVKLSLAGGLVNDTYKFPVNARYARIHHKEEGVDEETKDEEKIKQTGHVNDDGQKDGEKVGEESGESKAVEGSDHESNGEHVGEATEKKEPYISDLYFGIQKISSYPPTDEEDYDEEEEMDGEEEEDEEEENDAYSSDDDKEKKLDDLGGARNALNEFDVDYDSDIVNDEDLEELLALVDKIENSDDLVEDENRKKFDGFESFVSWTKMIYGADHRTYAESPIPIVTEDAATDSVASSASLETCKDSGSAPARMRSRTARTCRPTVVSRFYRALRTRNFRRWLV